MRIVTSAVLGATAIMLGVVIATMDRNSKSGAGGAEEARILTRFDNELVDRITLKNVDKQVIIERKGNYWFFTEPEMDRADAGAINALLDQLNHLDTVDTMGDEGETLSPNDMGIEGDQAIDVVVEGPVEEDSKKRFKNSVTLGVEAPREASIYARRNEDGKVYVVDGNPRKWIESPTEVLRDARLISAPPEGVVQLVVRTSEGEVALNRRITPPRQDWAIVKPMRVWASRDVVDELLANLSSLKVSSVERGIGKLKIPSPLPENSAVIQMQVFGVEQPLTAFLKQVEAPPVAGAPALLEASVSDRPIVFGLQSQILEQIPSDPDAFRNRTLANIPMAFLDSIYIQSRIDPDVHLKSEKLNEALRWDVSINGKLVPANQSQVSELVAAVNEASILDFASDTAEELPKFGLAPPSSRIAFSMKFPGPTGPDGEPGQIQTIYRLLNLGWIEGEQQRLYANFDGEEHIYELDPSFFGSIPTHPIKWRSLTMLTINPFHLRSITREHAGENLTLQYKYTTDSWEAYRSGVDATATLDVLSARKLRDRLGSFTAASWSLSIGGALEALQNPSAVFKIATEELDPARGDKRDKLYILKFSKVPGSSSYFYGQLEGSPDVFLVHEDKYRELLRPVTTHRAANP